jgi:hypothetical protein
MPRPVHGVLLLGALALAGCAVAPPTAPSILALPGAGKSLQAFQQDDAGCRQYASSRVAGAAQYASEGATGSAAAGTLLGAAAGTLLGAAAGNPGAGAAIGGGTGLLVGSSSGANAAAYSAAGLQRQYDIAYAQCMTAAGNTVPQPTYRAYAYPYPFAYAYPLPPPYGYPYPVY